MAAPFTYYNQYKPCPVCGGKKDCRKSADGLQFCHGRRGEDVLGQWHYLRESANGVWSLYVEEGRQYDHGDREEWAEVRAAARAAAAARAGAEAVPETPAEPPPAVPPA